VAWEGVHSQNDDPWRRAVQRRRRKRNRLRDVHSSQGKGNSSQLETMGGSSINIGSGIKKSAKKEQFVEETSLHSKRGNGAHSITEPTSGGGFLVGQ